MGSETIKLPIIDFSNLKQQTPSWESTKTQVWEALEEYGCFEAKFDQIPVDLRASVLHGVKQLFDLPLEIKLRNKSNNTYRGYFGQYATAPLYESWGIEDALSPEKLESFSNFLWTQGNPSFSKSVQSCSEQLSELDKIVRRMVLESLGLEKYMDEHMDSATYIFRCQKYDVPQSNETELGLGSHTDKNFVTILCQLNEVRGLEVQTKDGEWITVEPSVNSFVVMVGDALHAWTNGRLHSTSHRVMMAETKPRYSIGLFSTPRAGYMIKAPEETVDEEHPLLFKPFDHHQFLEFYYSRSNRNSVAALKEYCGA